MGRIKLPAWARAPQISPDGEMSLFDHLREFRYRLVICALAVVITSCLAAIWYQNLFWVLLHPYEQAVQLLTQKGSELRPATVIEGVTTPFTLALKVCVTSGLVAACPVWLYHLWKFIVPALKAKEKKYAAIFLGTAIPLFCAGVAVGYYVLPQGISVLMSFTPEAGQITNLLEVNNFLSLTVQLMMIFGLGFLMPVVVVGLNFMGVVTAVGLGKVRMYVIFGIFVFSAVCTPSTDPFSMLALSLPMVFLYLIAEAIARIHDRRVKNKQA